MTNAERDQQIREAMERHWETSKGVMYAARPAKWHCIRKNGTHAAGHGLFNAPQDLRDAKR